jgi:hypothetical protein
MLATRLIYLQFHYWIIFSNENIWGLFDGFITVNILTVASFTADAASHDAPDASAVGVGHPFGNMLALAFPESQLLMMGVFAVCCIFAVNGVLTIVYTDISTGSVVHADVVFAAVPLVFCASVNPDDDGN